MAQRTRKLMMIHQALHPEMMLIDCMCQEKKEKEDLRAFKIISIQLEEFIKKARRKTDYSDQKRYRQHKHQQNKNNQRTKMERKTTVWIFQETKKRSLDRAKKRNS